jgi:hypothetical protein
MRDGFFIDFLLMLVRRSPMLLLAIGGIVFALVRWKLHPRASLMTLIALVIFILDVIGFFIVSNVLPDLAHPMLTSVKAIDWFYFFMYFFDDFIYALVLVLLIAAAYTGRRRKPAESTP